MSQQLPSIRFLRITSLIMSILYAGTFLSSCSIEVEADSTPAPQQKEVTKIEVDEKVLHFSALETIEQKGPYKFGEATSYSLHVEEASTVRLVLHDVVATCEGGGQWAGPYVTLHKSEQDMLSTDAIAHTNKAIQNDAFVTALAPGQYDVDVSFYGESTRCKANFTFVFANTTNITTPDPDSDTDEKPDGQEEDNGDEGNSDDSGAIGDNEGDSDTPGTGDGDDSGNDGETALDSLVGTWQFTLPLPSEPDEEDPIIGRYRISFDVHGYVIWETWQNDTNISYEQLNLTIIDASHFDLIGVPGTSSASDHHRCLFEVRSESKELALGCNRNMNSYPGSFGRYPYEVAPKEFLTKEKKDLKLPIPDNNDAGIGQTISVTENEVIRDITVTVNITHPFSGDLSLRLVHPSGAEVLLYNRTGGAQDNLMATFGTGGVKPVGDLSTLYGFRSGGDWRLVVADHQPEDQGQLNRVALRFTY